MHDLRIGIAFALIHANMKLNQIYTLELNRREK